MKRQIIALGGGGYLYGDHEEDPGKLNEYIVSQANKEHPKICFISTPQADKEVYINRFTQAFSKLGCEVSVLTLFPPNPTNMKEHLLAQDIVYVCCGNTKNALALWREWGLDSMLKEAYEAGVIMTGISAGCLCWHDSGVTDSIPGQYVNLPCMGFVEYSACPHYNVPKRRLAYQSMIKEGTLPAGYGLDEHTAIHYVNEVPELFLSQKPNMGIEKVESNKVTVLSTQQI